MARHSHPWFRRSDGGGTSRFLASSRSSPADGAARQRRSNGGTNSPWSVLPIHRPTVLSTTVASVIDLYLTHSKRLYASQSYANRCHYYNCFAEAHGFRPVRDCLPVHFTMWLDAHTEWISDWTAPMSSALSQRTFNWAVQQGRHQGKPFRGITQRVGEARRPMTDQEFRAFAAATTLSGRRAETSQPPPPNARERFRKCSSFSDIPGQGPAKCLALLGRREPGSWGNCAFEAQDHSYPSGRPSRA